MLARSMSTCSSTASVSPALRVAMRELAKAHVRQRPDQCDRDDARAEIEADLLVECERHVNQPTLDNKKGRAQADRIVMVR